ncbi:MAG: ferrochelatase, partial [Candidatus Lambdaproteobacteria bacterium]|nr:ferrochelatase [Candidatus Lambdaproteobacteria bacterium]
AHRYLAGWCARVAGEIVAAGVDDLLALPLYPHYSYATTGSALQQLAAALRAAGFAGRLSALRSYPDAPGYLDAMAERLRATLSAAAPQPAATVILCSAHGLPAVYVERGDPYRLELYRTLEALRGRFPGWRFALSFQSRVGPAEWLRPYTDEMLKELAGQATRTVVFVPLSFVNDHLETLYEVERLYFPMCRELGMTPHRVAAIEHHPAFIETLAAYARAWDAGRAGVPAAELLPPDQHWRRVGRWSWLAWALALLGVLWLAFC